MSTPAASAVVLVIGPAVAPELRNRLAVAGLGLVERSPDNVPDGIFGYAAALLDGRSDESTALAVCRRLA